MSQENQENKSLAMINNLAQLDHINFAKQIATNIKEGTVEPLSVLLFLKRFEALGKTINADEEIKEAYVNSANKYIVEGKSFDLYGAKLTVAAVSTTYDFTNCNDPVWTALNDIQTRVKVLLKEREDFLKAAFPEKAGSLFGVSAPVVVVDKVLALQEVEVGDKFALNKPVKIQKTGVKVTLPKS